MKIKNPFHCWAHILARLLPGVPARPRTRASHPSAPRRGPTARWRTNPVSGRLECRWIIADVSAPCRDPFAKRAAIRHMQDQFP